VSLQACCLNLEVTNKDWVLPFSPFLQKTHLAAIKPRENQALRKRNQGFRN
jgi:hypothetical protein